MRDKQGSLSQNPVKQQLCMAQCISSTLAWTPWPHHSRDTAPGSELAGTEGLWHPRIQLSCFLSELPVVETNLRRLPRSGIFYNSSVFQ